MRIPVSYTHLKIVEIASELGYIRLKKGSQVDDRRLDYLEPDQVVIITTGSQGEPMSGLVRMSRDEHRYVSLRAGDMVVISASPIPGNEKAVSGVIDRLYRKGVHVVYHDTMEVHVSGHARQEEQKLIMALTKPKFFMPVHGEYHHLLSHAHTAMAYGIPQENIMVAENGNVLEPVSYTHLIGPSLYPNSKGGSNHRGSGWQPRDSGPSCGRGSTIPQP